MLAWFFDPKVFNYFILTVYAMTALRWGLAGKWADMSYWIFAFGITATVTFGYKH